MEPGVVGVVVVAAEELTMDQRLHRHIQSIQNHLVNHRASLGDLDLPLELWLERLPLTYITPITVAAMTEHLELPILLRQRLGLIGGVVCRMTVGREALVWARRDEQQAWEALVCDNEMENEDNHI